MEAPRLARVLPRLLSADYFQQSAVAKSPDDRARLPPLSSAKVRARVLPLSVSPFHVLPAPLKRAEKEKSNDDCGLLVEWSGVVQSLPSGEWVNRPI